MPKGSRTAGRLRTEEKLKHGLKMQEQIIRANYNLFPGEGRER